MPAIAVLTRAAALGSEAVMPMSPAAPVLRQDNAAIMGDADLLPRQPIFCARNLEPVCEYLSGVLAPHRLNYLTRERRLNFRHRGAKLGAIELNALQYGGESMVAAPHFPDNYYLLQFMLDGNCALTQGGHSYDMAAGSVAVINPCRPFTKSWSTAGRQLLIRIDRGLLEHELQGWTGRDQKERIEFDQSQAFAMGSASALTSSVRMLCNLLRNKSSGLDHPLVRDRVASTLASALLVELPHTHSRAFDVAETTVAPASVRRAERLIEENAARSIGLADVAGAAGVSARALQLAFRHFRNTTPMAHLRALRLELARSQLAGNGPDAASVTSVANAYGFGCLGRFAADYKARFDESPSETLRRHASQHIDLLP
jgi:AraC-like DNA-binding protein